MKVTIRYPTSWGQQKTKVLQIEKHVISMADFQIIVQNETLIRKSDQIIKFMRFGKLDMNKRYYKKLQKIQQNKQKQQQQQQLSNGDDSSSYSRSRSNNIFQLQRLHDSNLDTGYAQDSDQGGGTLKNNNHICNNSKEQNHPHQYQQQLQQYGDRENAIHSKNRDIDAFRYNSLSQGPMSTNDSPSKDFMEFSSTKNDIISNNMQTSIHSTERSSRIFPQSFLKKINQQENQVINSNGYTIHQYQEAVNMLQKAIIGGEYDEVKEIYNVNQKQLEMVKEEFRLQNNFNILFDVSITGWNCIHCCCFYCDWEEPNQKSIFQFILSQVDKFQDSITIDDYTSLQLAIYRDQIEIVKYLIQNVHVDVNFVTIRGSALHIACRKGLKNIVRYFLTKTSINQELKDENDCSALDLANPSIQDYVKQNTKYFKKINSKEKSKESFLQGIPEKPALIRGKVHRHLISFMMQEKVLEINPDICSLVFYDCEADIPMKPGDIYPIKDIEKVEQYAPSFFMKKKYFYIKIFYDSEIIIGFKHKSTQTLWLYHLRKALDYCKFVEEKIQNYVFQQNYVKLERSFLLISVIEDDNHILTLEDKERVTDQFQKKKKKTSTPIIISPPLNIQSNIEKSPQKQRENNNNSNNIVSCEKYNPSQNTNNIFKLDHIEESKNEDIVSNRSKLSYLKPSCLEESEKIRLSSFDILDIIGSGAFGRVFLAQKKNTKKIYYALKSLKKHQLLNKNYLKYAQTELNILKSCKNPFIIGLHASFQTQNYIFMALDYCPGGDLGLILAQKNGMKEKTIKFIIAQVILAVEYLHNMNVVYRDLKPENILLDIDGYIKLADFGLSRENVKDNQICKSFCGSPAYISPEQLLKIGATKKTDVYGIGCIMYEMYSGNPPFYDQDIQILFENIKTQSVAFNENFSPLCRDLLEKMLHKEYEKRPSIIEVKSHPYFKKMDWNELYHKKIVVPEEIMECIDINGPIQNNYNYSNVTIFKDAEYDKNITNQKHKIDNWSFNQHHHEQV